MMQNRSRTRNQSGFSLVETLVALMIMSLITITLVSALRLASQYALRLGEDSGELMQREDMLSFASAIESTLQIEADDLDRSVTSFQGDEKQIKFLSTADIGPLRGAISQFRLHLQPSSRCEGGSDLVLDWAPGLLRSREVAQRFDRRRLVSCAKRVELSYFGRRAAERLPDWYRQWDTQERPPRFVQFKIETEAGLEANYSFALKYAAP